MPEIGFLSDTWWGPVLYFIVAAHLTNLATTIYLHRSQTHRGVDLSPLVALPMRAWLWLTTGIVTKEWVACHRKHHAHVDREGDPHSPVLTSLSAILFRGWAYYKAAISDRETLARYGKGTPDDWFERHVFAKHRTLGILLLLAIDVLLCGWWGLLVWLAQILLMPIQGGIVNGVGHALGYRNFDSKDHSKNFLPFGIWLVGEELHNNHHADPRSARFRSRWFEIDVGWMYIRLLSLLGLATVLHARPLSARGNAVV